MNIKEQIYGVGYGVDGSEWFPHVLSYWNCATSFTYKEIFSPFGLVSGLHSALDWVYISHEFFFGKNLINPSSEVF